MFFAFGAKNITTPTPISRPRIITPAAAAPPPSPPSPPPTTTTTTTTTTATTVTMFSHDRQSGQLFRRFVNASSQQSATLRMLSGDPA